MKRFVAALLLLAVAVMAKGAELPEITLTIAGHKATAEVGGIL